MDNYIDGVIRHLGEHGLITPPPDSYLVTPPQDDRSHLRGAEVPPETLLPVETARGDAPWWPLTPEEISERVLIGDGDATPLPAEETLVEEKRLRTAGTDALAWYRSFHWAGGPPWGIYILDRGVHLLARRLVNGSRRKTSSYNTADAIRVAFRTLHLHEYFHFVTDVAAATLETAAIARGASHTLYRDYVRDIYLSPRGDDEPQEEALANAFAFERSNPRPFRGALRAFMRKQPAGYSNFETWLDELDVGCVELGTRLASGTRKVGWLPLLDTVFDVDFRYVTARDCPVRIVHTISDPRYRLGFVVSIPPSKLIESSACKKDLKKLPAAIRTKYDKAKLLLNDTTHPSLQFGPLRACDSLFSFRVDRNYRAAVRRVEQNWEVVRVLSRARIYRELCR